MKFCITNEHNQVVCGTNYAEAHLALFDLPQGWHIYAEIGEHVFIAELKLDRLGDCQTVPIGAN